MGGEEILLAMMIYALLVAILAGLLHDLNPALVVAYILVLGARLYKPSPLTRAMLVLASILLIPTTPLVTSRAPTRIPLPLHVLLVYTTNHTNPPTTTRVLALDWGQVGLVTLAAETLPAIVKAKKGRAPRGVKRVPR